MMIRNCVEFGVMMLEEGMRALSFFATGDTIVPPSTVDDCSFVDDEPSPK